MVGLHWQTSQWRVRGLGVGEGVGGGPMGHVGGGPPEVCLDSHIQWIANCENLPYHCQQSRAKFLTLCPLYTVSPLPITIVVKEVQLSGCVPFLTCR